MNDNYEFGKFIGRLIVDFGMVAVVIAAVVAVVWWNKRQAAKKPPAKPDA